MLKRRYSALELGLFNLTLGVGIGIFVVVMGAVGRYPMNTAGANMPISILIGAIPAISIAVVLGKICTVFTGTGPDYSFLEDKLGKFSGFLSTWGFLIALPFAMAGAAIVPVKFLVWILNNNNLTSQAEWVSTYEWLFSIAIMFLCFVINYLGVEGKFAYLSVVVTLLLGGIVTVVGLNHDVNEYPINTDPIVNEVFSTNLPQQTYLGILLTGVLLMFSYNGLTFAISAGEETKNPGKSMFNITFWPTVIATIFFFLVAISVYNSVPWQYIAAQSIVEGENFTVINAVSPYVSTDMFNLMLVFLAIVLIDNIPILAFRTSRLIYTLSTKELLPKKLSSLNTLGIPKNSLLIVYLFTMLSVIIIHFPPLGMFAIPAHLLSYSLIGYAALKTKKGELPFKNHLSYVNFKINSWVAVISSAFLLVVIIIAEIKMVLIWLMLLAMGIIGYAVNRKRKVIKNKAYIQGGIAK